MNPVVAFRVDGIAAIGSGHVFRCLTLADALRRRGARCVFLCRFLTQGLADRIVAQGHALVPLEIALREASETSVGKTDWFGADWRADAVATEAALKAQGTTPRWLVVDHYRLDVLWERALRPRVEGLVVIDDLADREHDCDILLDQNLQDQLHDRYAGKLAADCRTLLGPRYALLREEFAQARAAAPQPAGRRVLISMGGADLGDQSGRILEACLEIAGAGLEVEVIVGADYPHLDRLRRMAQGRAGVDIQVSVNDLASRLTRATIAVGAGGVSMWERCCLGVPMLNIAIAANQVDGALALGRAGGAIYLGQADELDPAMLRAALVMMLGSGTLRESLRATALAIVDGRGAERVADLLMPPEITIRPANAGDRDPIFAWRNDPSTRVHFFGSGAIGREEHARWFSRVLQDPGRRLLVAERDGAPIAVVRYDIDGDAAEISVYLVPGMQGAGLGSAVIASADRWLVAEMPQVASVRASVLASNPRSGAAFAKAGYRDVHHVFFRSLRLPAVPIEKPSGS